MSFPTTPVIDSFSDSVMTGWNAALFGDIQDDGSVALGTNNTAPGYNIRVWGTPYSEPQEIYATISTKGATGNSVILGCMIKDETVLANIDGYQIVVTVSAGTDTWSLQRVDNGSATTLTSGTQEYSSGDAFGVRVANGTISAWYSSGGGAYTMLGSATDTTYTGTGYLSLSVTYANIRIDNFGGGRMRAGKLIDKALINSRARGVLV